MSASPDIQIAYRCDVCHECVIENVFTMNKRERELGAPVCRECEDKAEAAVISLVVDSVTRPDPAADPYTRMHAPIPAMCRCVDDYREEFRPPTHRVPTRCSMLMIGLITIAAGYAVANWWMG